MTTTPDETTGEDRAIDAIPTAAALIVAVDAGDPTEVADILTALDTDDLYALAVVLAAHIDPDRPLAMHGTQVSPIAACSRSAAAAFGIPMTAMRGDCPRTRDVLDARAVAIYAAKVCDPAAAWTAIGRYVGRDHSTVIHAHTRVGENDRLRRIAVRIADQVGRTTLPVDMEATA